MDENKYYRMKVQEILDDLDTATKVLGADEAARHTDQFLGAVRALLEHWLIRHSIKRGLLCYILRCASTSCAGKERSS